MTSRILACADGWRHTAGERRTSPPPSSLQVLAGVDDPLDGPMLVLHLAHERLHVHDPLPLLAGDLRPVDGVGRVGEVLVLLELLTHRGEQVVFLYPLFTRLD